MAEKKNFLQLTKSIGLIFNIGTELYYSHLTNGEKMYHFFHLGMIERDDYPDTKIFTIILPFLYIAVGYTSVK